MNKYIQRLIKEQFNINDLDFSDDDQEYGVNIFNKEANHPYYYNILDGTATKDEINELDSLVGVAIPENKDELMKIIKFYSKKYSKHSLNWLNVSGITDMSHLFEETRYNGDISKWDTSNVTNMRCMFRFAKSFNQPIGDWNVDKVTDMSYMFFNASTFNQYIGDWDVSSVTNMHLMFNCAKKFNQPISNWNVSNVTDMFRMFCNAENFNQDISSWNISDKVNRLYMF